jgi:hypothetical protein
MMNWREWMVIVGLFALICVGIWEMNLRVGKVEMKLGIAPPPGLMKYLDHDH